MTPVYLIEYLTQSQVLIRTIKRIKKFAASVAAAAHRDDKCPLGYATAQTWAEYC